jgi:hypothetical protein
MFRRQRSCVSGTAMTPAKFEEFARRYRAELEDPERAEALQHLRELATGHRLTLLTATKNPNISQAEVLCDLLGRRHAISTTRIRVRGVGIHVVARRVNANCSLRCPVVVGCGRLSVGNTHASCWGTGHSRWSQACRPWSVNPSRKLRRFESFTCHHVLRGPLTCGNAGWGPSSCTPWGYPNGGA